MNTNESALDTQLPDFNSQSARNYRKWRHVKDVATRYLMAFGGIGVILAIGADCVLFILRGYFHV